ncbi:MAG: FAD-binding protein [Candidatus Moraniibacteriota bacterium]
MVSPLASPNHREKVQRLQADVRRFFAAKKKVRIYHGGTNSTRPLPHQRDSIVDISSFTEVLSLDPEEESAWVEPNVPMKALVDATLAQGLIPPVVMELRSITVGGGIQGGAGESSSFRFGLFHDNCLAFEAVLGNGDIITASPTENPEFFTGLPCTYGTIAVITAAKLKLIKAKPYVRLRYDRVENYTKAITQIKAATQRPEIDFIDAIIFRPGHGVVMTGSYTDITNAVPLQQTLRARDDWFYIQAEKITRRHAHAETVLPIRDYLFRYNRGAFWTGRYGFELLHLPFIRALRFILSPIFKTRILYHLLHTTGVSQRYLIQDCSLPQETIFQFLDFLDSEIKIYPLWICPLRPPRVVATATYGFLDTELMINVGIWGKADLPYTAFVALNRRLEKIVTQLKGCKVLYAHSYYTEEEFWSIYRRDYYDRLRELAFAHTVFPNIYEKVIVKEQVRQAILTGLLRGLLPPYRLPLK